MTHGGHINVRGHGPTGQYKDNYPPKLLRTWADSLKWQRKGLRVECYFDNDQKSAAPHDACRLMELMNDVAGRRSSAV